MKNEYVILQNFTYSSEAQIIKARLRAEGIEAFLVDEYTVDTDPLISNAIGGVKLAVWDNQAKAAREVLEEIEQFSMDDNLQYIQCPKCNSEEVDYFTTIKDWRALVSYVFVFFLVILPFYTKYVYRCNSCRNQFNLNG